MLRLGKIEQQFKSIKEKIKILLGQPRWKEALIFFYFVLLAFGFWIVQSLQQEYEIDIPLPIEYKEIPPDIAFIQPPPKAISVKIKDKGSILLYYTFGWKIMSLQAQIPEKKKQNDFLIIDRKEIENKIKKQLQPSTSLVGFEPQRIELKYSKRSKKKMPVVFAGSVSTKAGYKIAGDISISPDHVTVYAADQILDSLTVIRTASLSLKGDKEIKRTASLQKIEGVTFEPQQVSITIPIEEFTEKKLELPIVCNDLPRQYTLRTFPSMVKLNCNVPLSRFKEVSADLFSVVIPFSELEQNTTGSIPLKIKKKPDWVDGVILTPERVEFILERSESYY